MKVKLNKLSSLDLLMSIFSQKFGAIPHRVEKFQEFEKEETW